MKIRKIKKRVWVQIQKLNNNNILKKTIEYYDCYENTINFQ